MNHFAPTPHFVTKREHTTMNANNMLNEFRATLTQGLAFEKIVGNEKFRCVVRINGDDLCCNDVNSNMGEVYKLSTLSSVKASGDNALVLWFGAQPLYITHYSNSYLDGTHDETFRVAVRDYMVKRFIALMLDVVSTRLLTFRF